MKTDKHLKILDYAIICFGIFLRIKTYLANNSLWLDEAHVAVEILIKSFKDIFIHLSIFSDLPRLPLLFQVITKANMALFGNNEFALRLFPFICSLAALFVFYALLKRISSSWVATVALTLFAFNTHLISFSAQLKPYASDTLVTLIIFLLFHKVIDKDFSVKSMRIFGLWSALLLWLSFPSVFVSVSLLQATILWAIYEKDVQKIKRSILALLIIGFSFSLIFGLSMYNMAAGTNLKQWWSLSFPPYSEGIVSVIFWSVKSLIHVFANPVATTYPVLSFVFFCFGMRALIKHNHSFMLLLIFAPILTVLIAAFAQIYPFSERMLLFLTPLFTVLVAQGVVYFSVLFKRTKLLVCLCFVVIILAAPLSDAFLLETKKGFKEDNRPALIYLKENYQKGDVLFYNNSAQYPLFYYLMQLEFAEKLQMPKQIKGLKEGHYHIRVAKMSDQIVRIDNKVSIGFYYEYLIFERLLFTGLIHKEKNFSIEYLMRNNRPDLRDAKRVWLFLSHMRDEPKALILDRFARLGHKLDSYEGEGSGVYLFRLNEEISR